MSRHASETIGLVGLGLLGSALAERLRDTGFHVLGFDIDPEKRRALEALEARPLESAENLARQNHRVVFSLPDSNVVAGVLDEIEEHLEPGMTIIDTTTGDPDQIAAFGPRLAARGVFYLDATVGGSSALVRKAEAIVLVGGAEQAFDSCRGIFATFARRAFHLGGPGSGARMKLVFNLVLGLHRAVLAEALHSAQASGIEPAMALEVLQAGAASSRVMDAKGPKMVESNFHPEAKLSQHLKDVRLMLAAAEKNGISLPLSALHRSLLETAQAAGFGDADNSAVIKAFEVFVEHPEKPD